MLCEYGCGQEAIHQFKNGKWCCSKHLTQCPIYRKINSIRNIGKKRKPFKKPHLLGENKKELCAYGCGQEAKYRFNNGKLCCNDSINKCPVNKENLKIKHHGKEPWNKGKIDVYSIETLEKMSIIKLDKKHSIESLNKMKISSLKENLSEDTLEKMHYSHMLTIEQIKVKYPTFGKEEEMRYNPDKPIKELEIQVHCKNHDCENSKEKGGWFTPTRYQIYSRGWNLDNEKGNDGSYMYCSQHCRNTCPLYKSRGNDPLRNLEPLPFTSYQRQIWDNQVLEQDNNECQICGSKENLHCHHLQPIKLQPELSLDPSNGIVLCVDCHYKYGHKSRTECSNGKLAKIICKKKGNLYVKKTNAVKELSK